MSPDRLMPDLVVAVEDPEAAVAVDSVAAAAAVEIVGLRDLVMTGPGPGSDLRTN